MKLIFQKKVILILTIGFLFIVLAIILIGISNINEVEKHNDTGFRIAYIPYFNEISADYDLVAELLWRHRDYFEWLYDVVGSRDIGAPFKNNDSTGLLNLNLKSYFTSAEWNTYKLFVEENQPYSICFFPEADWVNGTKCSLPVIEFNFVEEIEGDAFNIVRLFYIHYDSEEDLNGRIENTIHSFQGIHSLPVRVKDHWYCQIIENYKP